MVIVIVEKKEGRKKGQSSKKQRNQKRRYVHSRDRLPLEVARDTKTRKYASFAFGACAKMLRCTAEVERTNINLVLLSAKLCLCTRLGESHHFKSHLPTTSPK